MITLRFVQGTLELHGLERDDPRTPPECVWDPRAACHRAAAIDYAPILLRLHQHKEPYEDEARAYTTLDPALIHI